MGVQGGHAAIVSPMAAVRSWGGGTAWAQALVPDTLVTGQGLEPSPYSAKLGPCGTPVQEDMSFRPGSFLLLVRAPWHSGEGSHQNQPHSSQGEQPAGHTSAQLGPMPLMGEKGGGNWPPTGILPAQSNEPGPLRHRGDWGKGGNLEGLVPRVGLVGGGCLRGRGAG